MRTTFGAAFYARVSTEDRQSPLDSIAWQRSVASVLLEPHDGKIVAEYLDVGVSRSLSVVASSRSRSAPRRLHPQGPGPSMQ